MSKNQEEALEIVAKKTKESVPVLRETIKAKRVRFQQLTAESQEKALMALFKLGVESGMIAKLPDGNFFYRGPNSRALGARWSPPNPVPAPHRFNFAAVVSVGLLLIVWQVASFFLPEFIVPGLQLIGLEFVKVFEDGTLVSDSLLTLVRVMLGLIGVLFSVGLWVCSWDWREGAKIT